VLNIDGILFRLIDTAGIRNHSHDVIENFGIEKSLQKMKQADMVIYLFDPTEIPYDELQSVATDMEQKGINYLLVGNKIDRSDETDMRMKYPTIDGLLFISAKNGFHLEVLKERMMDLVLKDVVSTENVIVTNARHYHALIQVNEALNDVMEGLRNKIPGDLLALDIRRSLQYLGEITGEITNEDQLDYIFSKFCIGK
jgi:tRNA modification GTPase